MSERYLISRAENCLYVDDLSGKHRWAFTSEGGIEAEVSRRLMCEAFTDGWNAHRECWARERSELHARLQSISDERDRLTALTEDLRAAQPARTTVAVGSTGMIPPQPVMSTFCRAAQPVGTAKPESEKEGEL